MGAVGEWGLSLRVPPYFGIDGPMELAGTALIEPEGGEPVRSRVKVQVPMQSPLVAIEPVGIGTRDADIRVKNRSDRSLTIDVYLLAQPGYREKTWVQEVLAVGEERTYRIDYAQANPAPSEVLVSVSLTTLHAYVNKKYDIPARP